MKQARGFTLIEVLVALLVFGMIATAAAQVGSQYISSFERIRDKTLASWIADNRINEIRLQEGLPSVRETTTDTEYGQFQWQVTTSITATEESTMRRVEISVARYREEGADPVSVHTLSGFVGQNQ